MGDTKVDVSFGSEGHKPPVFQESKTVCVAEMTPEERDEYFKDMPKELQAIHEERKKRGYYNRCPKTDRCKVEREKKEAEEKKKAERLETLEKREVMWESHARQQEETIKDQAERLARAEARLEKVAGLLAQIISKA